MMFDHRPTARRWLATHLSLLFLTACTGALPTQTPPSDEPVASDEESSVDEASVEVESPGDEASQEEVAQVDVVEVEEAAVPSDKPSRSLPSCGRERWGGWEGTPACRAAARRTIPGVHRRCESAADCVRLGSSCNPHAVNRRFERRYRRWHGPCVGPGDGACGGPQGVVCSDGCCHPNSGLNLGPSR